MKCPNCGGEIKDKSKFCEYCGSSITADMQKEQEILNKEGCPKCKSSNVEFNRENRGNVKGKKGTSIIRETVGVCKDCGYTWNTEDNTKKKKKVSIWIWIIGWIVIFPLPLTILLLRPTNKINKKVKVGIIAVAWIIYLLWLVGTRNKDENDSNKHENNNEITETIKPTEPVVTEAIITEEPVITDEPVVTEEATITEGADIIEIPEIPIISDAVDPDLKEFLDSYEAFIDDYCEFLENYDSSDVNMILEYTEMLKDLDDFSKKADNYDTDTMSEVDSLYYLEVMGRIEIKLLKAIENN